MRGLLLDLVATGDDDGVNAAAARYVALLRRERSSVGLPTALLPWRYQR